MEEDRMRTHEPTGTEIEIDFRSAPFTSFDELPKGGDFLRSGMRLFCYFAVWLISLLPLRATLPDGMVYARDGSGVSGYKTTPKLPWCDYLVHDPDRPAPVRVDSGLAPDPAPVPSDAIVLFDGKDLSRWRTNEWSVQAGEIVAGYGSLRTKEEFGDIQLHLEWLAPADFEGSWDNRGNNGVMLLGLYEIQIFDSYNEKLYPDGQAAAVYAQTPPLVNACRKPGQWQSYDMVFRAPRYEGDKLVAPPRLTMFHNGVLVHLDQEIYGETGHKVLPRNRRKISRGPLVLAGHHCPVRFRNIWLRKLAP
jgi:hypothetical protein